MKSTRRKPFRWIERLELRVIRDHTHFDLLDKIGFSEYIGKKYYHYDNSTAYILYSAPEEQHPMLIEAFKLDRKDVDEAIYRCSARRPRPLGADAT